MMRMLYLIQLLQYFVIRTRVLHYIFMIRSFFKWVLFYWRFLLKFCDDDESDNFSTLKNFDINFASFLVSPYFLFLSPMHFGGVCKSYNYLYIIDVCTEIIAREWTNWEFKRQQKECHSVMGPGAVVLL